MGKKIIIGIIAVLIVGLGGWKIYTDQVSSSEKANETQSSTSEQQSSSKNKNSENNDAENKDSESNDAENNNNDDKTKDNKSDNSNDTTQVDKDSNSTTSKDNKNESKDKENKKEEKLSDEEGKKIVEEVFGNFTLFHTIDSKKLELNSVNIKTLAAIKDVKEGSKKYTCKELFGNNIESLDDSFEKGSWRVENLLCSDGYQTLYSYSDVNSQYKKMFGKDVDALKSTIKMDNIFDGAYGYSKSENG